MGLSPRSRGNRIRTERRKLDSGTIPALAGEPRPSLFRVAEGRDYPRARGGTFEPAVFDLGLAGLSPRSRGNRAKPAGRNHSAGTIPALAGEPREASSIPETRGDYPRARGGTPSLSCHIIAAWGLSPRSRGNRRIADQMENPGRTIPALAGEPALPDRLENPPWDYPRARGGTT